MLKSLSEKIVLRIFLVIWTVLNLIQAYFTELAHDEAYYWTWSKHMDWGFLEHPPMVGVFIKLGYGIFQNELGLRLITVIASTFVIWLVYRYLIKKDLLLYLAMISSLFLFHVGGFLTAPDSPLYLFVALFYVLFKSYLEKDNWKISLALIFVLTAMMYSKYHGVLVIFFALVFNLSLLKRKSFWVMAIVSTLLFIPHLYWLFTQGGSGMGYALSGRFSDAMNLKRVFDYLGGQLVVTGPILGIVFFFALFKYKTKSQYEKTLKWMTVSIVVYFLLWSLKGRTEANWTASIFIPLVIISHAYISQKAILKKWVLILSVPSILLMLAFRLLLVVDFLPLQIIDRQAEFHGWKDYAQRVDSLAGDMPVISTSYQNASKLWFYRDKITLPMNINDRPNQYNLWNYEKDILDEDVLVLSPYLHNKEQTIGSPDGSIAYAYYPKFRSYKDLEIEILSDNQVYKLGEDIQVPVRITAPEEWELHSNKDGRPVMLLGVIIEKAGESICWHCQTVDIGNISSSKEILFDLILPARSGVYDISFVVDADDLMIWKVSESVEIEITE